MIVIREITFGEILPMWRDHLWPGRTSAIESNSAITYRSHPPSYNMAHMQTKATFLGAFDGDLMVGCNSGHGARGYRSRGLYVNPAYRGRGLGVSLLKATIDQGQREAFQFVWSMPRESSLKTYEKAGFEMKDHWFETETSERNCYVALAF